MNRCLYVMNRCLYVIQSEGMCMCIYIYKCVCVYVCRGERGMYICTYVLYVHVSTCRSIYVYMRIYNTRVCMYACMLYIHTHVCTCCMYVYMRMYTRVCVCTCLYIYVSSVSRSRDRHIMCILITRSTYHVYLDHEIDISCVS